MLEGSFLKKLIFKGNYTWLRHLLFWVIYLIVFSAWAGFDVVVNFREGTETTLVFMPANLIYAYGIIYWLVPKILIKEKYFKFLMMFCVWMLAGLVMNFLTRYYILLPLRQGRPNLSFNYAYKQIFAFGSFIVMNTIGMFGGFIKFFKLWNAELRQKQFAEKEKINAELELLKAQLHPHFLFNTLNNLYSLVYEKSDRAPKMLMRLSGLLSYVLYECKADEVLLSKEVSIIKDYVALEKERYGERLDVSLNFSGDIDNKMVAPMLFQPFIENAFKHGTSEQLGKVWMSIDLSVKENQLYFKIINSCDNHAAAILEQHGVGIGNVKKRLELLYADNFQLQNGVEDNVYIVSLSVELKAAKSGPLVVPDIPVLKPAS
ncbi:MAG TPA: histidine kinase [Hanamia sp.]|nr:histidine kinase [Hanamia sp.]